MASLPENIDLTANRDFSTRASITIVTPGFSAFDDDTVEDDVMTVEQYDYIEWRNRFFGRPEHSNRARSIFRKSGSVITVTCRMCGKDKRVPWDFNNYWICPECAKRLGRQENAEVPWVSPIMETDRTVDIFSLR